MNRLEIERASEACVRVDVSVGGAGGNGSGLIFQDGTVLTCEHVVNPGGRRADSINVVTLDGRASSATVVGTDRLHDAAVLSVEGLTSQIQTATYDEVNLVDDCLIFGYPARLPRLSVSRGMISAKGQNLISQLPFDTFQIDARINRGNSGGPVFQESNGKVIGIVSMKYIPFMDDVDQLQSFVASIPTSPTGRVGIGGVDWGAFFNYVNQSVRQVANSLLLVQVGIGWAIPIAHFQNLIES